MTYPPTERAAQALAFIQRFVQARGIAPSFAEIQEALSLKSKSNVARIVDQLVERGHVKRIRHRARCIELAESHQPPARPMAFAGVGPFDPAISPPERERRALLLSDRLSYRSDRLSIVALRWLRVFAIDPSARNGCLKALNALPSLDRRQLLHALLPPGSVKPPKPVTERRVSA